MFGAYKLYYFCSLRIRLSYSDNTFGYTLSSPLILSQLLAFPAHGERTEEHVGGLLISNSCIKYPYLPSIDIPCFTATGQAWARGGGGGGGGGGV